MLGGWGVPRGGGIDVGADWVGLSKVWMDLCVFLYAYAQQIKSLYLPEIW